MIAGNHDLLFDRKPKLHVFGHIHGSHGKELAWGGIVLVNCAVLDNERVLAYPPTVVTLTP